MSIIDAFLLGLVQGLTEFLPVSSSGHLALIKLLRGTDFPHSLAFDVVLHVATLLSVLIAFRKALVRVLCEDRWMIPLIILSTSFLGLALLPVSNDLKLKDLVEKAQKQPMMVAGGFLITALLLTIMTWLQRRKSQSPPKERLSYGDAALIGVLQLFAIFPGISRSGSTISGALSRRVSTDLAFEYAFLLSIPAILGAVILEAKDIAQLTRVQPAPLVVGFVTALVTGLLALGMVKWLLERDRFWLFIPYLVLCAILTASL